LNLSQSRNCASYAAKSRKRHSPQSCDSHSKLWLSIIIAACSSAETNPGNRRARLAMSHCTGNPYDPDHLDTDCTCR
jgi:hypothetical protein